MIVVIILQTQRRLWRSGLGRTTFHTIMQKLPPERASTLKYASITRTAITNKIVKNIFNAYSYHVIILKMESSASSSNSADADAATSLEVFKPHQPRTFSFPKRQF